MALYQEVRPATFDEIHGQDEAVKTMKNIIAAPHAKRPKVFLMCGPSGCGKTTMVYAFAQAIGCRTNTVDFRNLDASKDRSIEMVRLETSKMGNAPMYKQAEARIWLFDECHQLLTPAQEALLKVCEEVPQHTYIFFATTEPEKLGKALKSRCKVITINPMSPKALLQSMILASEKASIKYNEEAFKKMCIAAEGNTRVALQILETYALNGGDAEAAIKLNAGADAKLKKDVIELCRLIISRGSDWSAVKSFMEQYKGQAEGTRQALIGYLKSCLLGAKSDSDRRRVTDILGCFMEPLHYHGDAGLVYQISMAFDVK